MQVTDLSNNKYQMTVYRSSKKIEDPKSSSLRNKTASSQLIKDPVKLKTYILLRNQNSADLKRHYCCHNVYDIKSDTDENELLKEMFDINDNAIKLDKKDIDIIVDEKFNYFSQRVNFANSNLDIDEFTAFKNIKNDPEAFNELLKKRYEAYKNTFKQKKHDLQSNDQGTEATVFIEDRHASKTLVYSLNQNIVRSSILTEDEVDQDCLDTKINEYEPYSEIGKRALVGVYTFHEPIVKGNKETGSTLNSSIKSTIGADPDISDKTIKDVKIYQNPNTETWRN